MKAKASLTIACCSALTLGLCAAPHLAAQSSGPAPQATSSSIQDSTNDLYVSVGKTVLVDCARPLARIAVGLGDIAEASAVTPTEVMVNGKAPGQTSLILWDVRGGRQFFNVTVRPNEAASADSLEGIRRQLRMELPGQPLQVSYANGNVFLRGTVKDLTSSNRAVEIASTAGKVVNLLSVDVPHSQPQILLKVRFASVDLSLEQQLGINLFNTGLGNAVGGVTTGQFSAPTVSMPVPGTPATASLSSNLNLFAFFPGVNLGATLQALETRGVVQVLAEPNVLAADGKQASFLAGGEYPYPVVQGAGIGGVGAVTIMFKEFGVRLSFIPTIMPNGMIRLQVAPEVSSLDFTNAVQISGFTIPAIDVRNVQTEVELQDGQSFAIGGLLDNRDTESYNKIPFLGDIPILGKFFQSMQKTRTKTELIVIVTPEIVSPVPAETEIATPKYPTPFLPPNSTTPMHTPDAKTAANTPAPPPATIPVEKLVESMKPEKPLAVQSTTSMSGSGGASTSSSSGP